MERREERQEGGGFEGTNDSYLALDSHSSAGFLDSPGSSRTNPPAKVSPGRGGSHGGV